jgi:hypothetical protein
MQESIEGLHAHDKVDSTIQACGTRSGISSPTANSLNSTDSASASEFACSDGSAQRQDGLSY